MDKATWGEYAVPDSMPLNRWMICTGVLKYAPSWAARHVVPTFDGDADSAAALCAALQNQQRGEVAVALWRAKIPVTAYRTFLKAAWLHDHQEVIKAASTRRRLQAMFRYAQFDTSGQPASLRVWRGTSGLDFEAAAKGYSWTTDRDLACWFAMHSTNAERRPLVLRADVRRDMIACRLDEREEAEIVLLSPPAARLDGTPAEWRARHMAVHRRRLVEADFGEAHL